MRDLGLVTFPSPGIVQRVFKNWIRLNGILTKREISKIIFVDRKTEIEAPTWKKFQFLLQGVTVCICVISKQIQILPYYVFPSSVFITLFLSRSNNVIFCSCYNIRWIDLHIKEYVFQLIHETNSVFFLKDNKYNQE